MRSVRRSSSAARWDAVELLREWVASKQVDTVMVCFPDIYGRAMGKRFDARFVLEHKVLDKGTHACNYLLACDMNMNPIPGFSFANFERGYGDFHLHPDLSSIRRAAWLDKTALIIADLYDTPQNMNVLAPRSMLQRQCTEAENRGYKVVSASELEFYTYDTGFRKAHSQGYRELKSVSDVVQDYHLLQTHREEPLMRDVRNALVESGITVEGTKGEAGIGQHEINVVYDDAMRSCDNHFILKQCVKETADRHGKSVTFMSKPFTDVTGSGCHIHLNLVDEHNDNVFFKNPDVFRYFLGGWMRLCQTFFPFYAPNPNSYKRFRNASWAPTRIAWSHDNRTAGFRVVDKGGKGFRIEFRIPGADVNPYLVVAASIASGLWGIENRVEPPAEFAGNIYEAQSLLRVPQTFQEAIDLMEKDEIAHELLGQDVINHYCHFFRKENEAYSIEVSDWERKRYFEMI